MEKIFLSVCLGIGLSAACGFRVFVPLLCLSLASKAGFVGLTPSFAWIGTMPAIVAFSVATTLEIGAYYVPWLDNALDTAAAPIATVAGIVATAAVVTNVDPFWHWTLAVIAGGGVAASTQLTTTKARLTSTIATGGVANPLLATVESVSSAVLSAISVIWPILAFVLTIVLVVLCWIALWWVAKRLVRFFRKPAAQTLMAAS